MELNPKVNQDLVGTQNVGFIIMAQHRDKYLDTWVIGFNPHAQQFVTWFYNTECGGYSYGHYTQDFNVAVLDYNKRCGIKGEKNVEDSQS